MSVTAIAAAVVILLSLTSCKRHDAKPGAHARSPIASNESWSAPSREIDANIKSMHAADVHARRQAVYELATSNSPKVAPQLIEALNDGDSVVQYFAILGLGILREKRAVPMLLPLLGSQAKPELRRESAWALGRIAEPQARPGLIRLLAETNAELKLSAAQALARLGDAESMRALMGRDGGTLGGWKGPLAGLAMALDKLALLPDLEPAHGFASEEWGRLVAEIPECRGVPALLKAAAEMEPQIMAEHVLQGALSDALGRLPEGCSPVLIEKALREPSPKIRAFALKVLESYASPAVVEVARRACADPDDNVAAEAARLLSRLGARLPANATRLATLHALDPRDPEALPRLSSTWKPSESWEGLAQFNDSLTALRWLVRMGFAVRTIGRPIPADVVRNWYTEAVKASHRDLGATVDATPVALDLALELAAKARSDGGREYDAFSNRMAQAVELGLVDTIERLYREGDAKRRGLIVGAPLPVDEPGTLRLLRQATHDKDPSVRRATLTAMRRKKRFAQIEDAEALLKDPDREVQNEALRTIAALGVAREKALVFDPELAGVPELRAAWLEAALACEPFRAEPFLLELLQTKEPVLGEQRNKFLHNYELAPRAWHAIGRLALQHLQPEDPNRKQFAAWTGWTSSDDLAELANHGKDTPNAKAFVAALSDPDLNLRKHLAKLLLRAIERHTVHPTLQQWFDANVNSMVALGSGSPELAWQVATLARGADSLFAAAKLQSTPHHRWSLAAQAFAAGATEAEAAHWLPQLAPAAADDDMDKASAIGEFFTRPAVRRSPVWLLDLVSPAPKLSTITALGLSQYTPMPVSHSPRGEGVTTAALALLERPRTQSLAGNVLGNLAEPGTLPQIRAAIAGAGNELSSELLRAAYLAARASDEGSAQALLFNSIDGRANVRLDGLVHRLADEPTAPAKLLVEIGFAQGPSAYALGELLARRGDPHLDQLLVRMSDEPGLFARVVESRLRLGMPVPLSLARQAIHHPESETQRAAAIALGAAHEREFLPQILRATCDGSFAARYATATFSTEELQAGLNMSSAAIRACTLELLSQRNDGKLESAIVGGLRDPSPAVLERSIALAAAHPTAAVLSTIEQILRERLLPPKILGRFLTTWAHAKGGADRARLEAMTALLRPIWYHEYREIVDHPSRDWEPYNSELWCSSTGRSDGFVADVFANGPEEAKTAWLDCMARDSGREFVSQQGEHPMVMPYEVLALLSQLISDNPALGNDASLVDLLDRLDSKEARALIRRISTLELDRLARTAVQWAEQRWSLQTALPIESATAASSSLASSAIAPAR